MGSLEVYFHSAVAGLIGGLVLLYLAALTIAGVMVDFEQSAPGWRAVAHGVPIIAAAIVAAALGQGVMALCILTGAAVAALSLAPGISQLLEPAHETSANWAPHWRVLLPVTVLIWLIGFRAQVGWLGGAFLAIEGLAILWMWIETAQPPRMSIARIVIFLLAAALAVVASVLAIHGAMRQQMELP
ncbi:MAG TPA: hypothetical protein VG722_00870, partial [Tepidisphaeraceae bacterium]|nr:hypothetical protein [Tepidisphaeraceae bacterium]